MQRSFLTFASTNMSASLLRVHNQAIAMGAYDSIMLTNERNLDYEFREQFSKYLKPEVRGFGYWSWKAQIILQTLRQMNEGELLQYTDAGCHLNPKGRKKLDEYFQRAQDGETGILAFQAIPPAFHDNKVRLLDLKESKWCKGDLCDALEVRSNPSIMETQTIGAGIIFIRKCDRSMELIENWLNVYKRNFSLIDDSKSQSPNPQGFVEHRHDQSIFSILAKLNGVDTVSAYEYWYPDGKTPPGPDWEILAEYPIHAKRDKGEHREWSFYRFFKRVFAKTPKI